MKKGMTLIETLVAVIILAITVTGAMQLYTMNLRTSLKQDQYYYAENLLRQCIEEVRNKPFHLRDLAYYKPVSKSGPGDRYGKIESTNPIQYTSFDGSTITYKIELDTTIIRADSLTTPLARLKRIIATIKWGVNNSSSLKMCTIVEETYPQPDVAGG